MRVFLALVVGLALGAGIVWYLSDSRNRAHVQDLGSQVGDAAKSARDTLEDKLRLTDLRTNDWKEEFAKTGRIVRTKAHEAGQAIADATADARITGAVKARLMADSGLSSLKISVNTTGGVVTLSGTVPAPQDISKAMLVTLETDGVTQVISTMQVKPGS